MLNSETKRKIDSARNILVGNVTNPISQVDQITNALIYKFMDDMDQENLDVDLEAQFFVGDYAKYSWTKLLDKKLSGQERMNLYMQATESMSKNPHIPQLFRDIFKGAFLPYNDPRVLSLFLKEIDGFSYSHSEELGNAFEYLLSILGSQGDAGQFRTPRHIIDFIVEVVDPKKSETILDPACGTAGFLISAYKHILKAHDGIDNKTGKPTNKETNLTPDEKTKLMNNVVGYDVDPGMVKLSLVNMYLHGFQDPKIHKYNTLSDDKRWDEQFDIIMANPPFMTPKGGVETHKRFSIQANRAEVLFVDYIMDHLSIKGRAGIIVPEGIIFKSDKAYKALRKKLVEDGLFAVVSLPAGVFQPYSGVKTSILLFDNQLAKQTNEILFVKILNDGFDLGAQRRPRPDLPNDLFDEGGAVDVLKAQRIAIQTGNKNTLTNDKSLFAWVVKKEKIAENDDYNLSGERYKEVETYKHQKWEMVELGHVLEYEHPTKYIVKSTNYDNRFKTPVLTAGKTFLLGYTNETDGVMPVDKLPVIIFDDFTTAIKFVDFPFKVKSSAMKILHTDRKKADPRYLFEVMKTIKFNHTEHKRYWISQYSKIKIPLPPLEVQKEIVERIEVKQDAINHAKEIIKNLERERRYFGQEIRKLKDVEFVMLGEICEVARGGSPRPIDKFITDAKDGINWIKIGDVKEGEKYITKTKEKIKPEGTSKTRLVKEGDFILSNSMSFGRPYILKISGAIHDGWLLLRLKNKNVSPDYLYYILGSPDTKYQFEKSATGGVVKNLNSDLVRKIKIPLPPLEIQKQLVVEAEKGEEIIAANHHLIDLMEQKINNILNQI